MTEQPHANDTRHWMIEINHGHETVFRRHLPGALSEGEIATILQRLACRELSATEIIGASLRKPKRTNLLETSVAHPPNGKRTALWISLTSDFIAGRYSADELAAYPEIPQSEFIG